MHIWGDGFDWDGFDKAIRFFKKTYLSLTGKKALCKEKYGTLRLEAEHIWIENEQDIRNCQLALIATAYKYPQFTVEVLDDYLFCELPQEVRDALHNSGE